MLLKNLLSTNPNEVCAQQIQNELIRVAICNESQDFRRHISEERNFLTRFKSHQLITTLRTKEQDNGRTFSN